MFNQKYLAVAAGVVLVMFLVAVFGFWTVVITSIGATVLYKLLNN